MREAIRRRGRARRANPVTIPAPVNGWDQSARTKKTNVTAAYEFVNFIPDIGRVTLRGGSEASATGMGTNVETLMEYAFGTASEFFAVENGEIFDASAAGPVGAAAVTGLANSRLSHTMFSTSGGNFLVFVNGADGVRTYNGASWATQSITGATAADLDYVVSHKRRLWFIEKNSLSAWYLATESIAGAATEFPLGSVFRRGGALVALASWSRDGGAGLDDVFVAITSEGEVAVYEGTDPSSAATWGLVGVFLIDRPIGRRCVENVGADLVILTESGLVPASQVLISGSPQQVIPEAIRDAFSVAAQAYKGLFGWQIVNYRAKGWVLVNIPFPGGAEQYGLNLVTRKWFRLTGWNANCFGIYGGALYYGGKSGSTVLCDTGFNDLNAEIRGRIITGWDDFGTPRLKRFTMLRPLQTTTAPVTPLVEILTDYDEAIGRSAGSSIGALGIPWGSPWGTEWSGSVQSRNEWYGVTGLGSVGAIFYEVACKDIGLALSGFDLLMEPGDVL